MMRYLICFAAASLMHAADPAVVRIEADRVRATIVPEKGGEMGSLQTRHRGQWIETLYRAMDYSDKPGWTGKAPFLWPATGRNFPKDVKPNEEARGSAWDWNGARLPMPIHGFARDLPWKVETKSRRRAVLTLRDSESTRKSYPFGFRLAAEYTAAAGAVSILYTVTADEGNSGPMPFSAGNHITFNTPLVAGSDPLKMTFETPSTVEYLKAAGGIPTGEKRPRSYAPAVPLSQIQALTAISLSGYSGDPFMILSDPAGLSLRISQKADSAPSEPVVRFNVWGDPRNGYFSPEPWVGLQNSFNLRQGLVWLEPGRSWKWKIEIAAESK